MFFVLIFLVFAFPTFSQQIEEGKAILETEKILDKEIFSLNDRLKVHARLLPLMIRFAPMNTIIWKGIDKGDRCLKSPMFAQEQKENDCIHIEVFGFVGDDMGKKDKNLGARSKKIEITYTKADVQEKDPAKIPPRNLKKIKSQFYSNDFSQEEVLYFEVTDENPHTAPSHNDDILAFFQFEGYPPYGTDENPSEKGVGKFRLSSMNNNPSNDTRNSFKKEFYIKHLDEFDKLLNKFYYTEERASNQTVKKNFQYLKRVLRF